MSDYDKWAQPSLKEELARRGLPTSGTNPELVERLREWDVTHPADDDDLFGLGDTPKPASPAPAAAPQPLPPAAAPAVGPEPERPRVYQTKFEVRGELSTSMHEDNRHRAYHEAIAAGLIPRGGLSGVCRIGMERGPAGLHYAVYEVILAR